jgi:hypothetical protein
MGPGRTGVKGVIRDRNEATSISHLKHAKEIDELNKRLEKASLVGKTFLEDERDRNQGKGLSETESGEGANAQFWRTKGGRFGHLREVGVKGFVPAIEQEDRGVWVVVHLYEPVCSFPTVYLCIVQ